MQDGTPTKDLVSAPPALLRALLRGDYDAALGRVLIAALFLAGAAQKALDPAQAQQLLKGFGLPGALVWPALTFNLGAALCLILGVYVRPVARALALYCAATSLFHLVPSDGWQMSIFVKNWAIAGGLLVLSQTA